MKKTKLVSLSQLGKNWTDEAMRKYRHRYASNDSPNEAFAGIIKTDKQYETLKSISQQHINEAEAILNTKALNKWCVPQGGTFSQATLEKGVDSYYSLAEEVNEKFDDEITREAVHSTYRLLDNYGYLDSLRDETIIRSDAELYRIYKADHRSHAGFTGEGDRRDKSLRVKAIREASDMYDLDPVIAGMRRKDGKDRNIFNDSLANYFREARMYDNWFKWWRSLPYDMHYSDYQIANIIVKCAPKMSYAGDYEAMDKHHGLKSQQRVSEAFATFTGTTLTELSAIQMFNDELFTTTCIAGDTLYEGLHDLYSGIYPTHDVESVENFIIHVGFLTEAGFTVVKTPKVLRSNECFVMICGDDSFVLFGRKLSDAERQRLIQLHVKYAAAFGQVLEWSKVDISDVYVTFCKKTFALRQDVKGFKHYSDDCQTPVHKFSLLKAIHCIRYPENIPSFPRKQDLVIWVCSIMDNAFGATDWRAVMQTLCWYMKDLLLSVEFDYIISEEMQLILNADWYFRNYVSFELINSPSYNFMRVFVQEIRK